MSAPRARRRARRGWRASSTGSPPRPARPTCSRWSTASTPTPRSTASSSSCRCRRQIDANTGHHPHRPRQGRRRLPPGQRRAARDRARRASSPAPRSAASNCSAPSLATSPGKSAVVIGRSNIVGKPMALLLLGDSCTVTIAHSRTADLPDVVRRADIVVAAVGRPEMVKGDWLKPGATVDRRRHQPHRRAASSATSTSPRRRRSRARSPRFPAGSAR